MNVTDFNSLNIHEKANITWPACTYLASRFDGDFVVVTYRMPLFFVEVRFNVESHDITSIQGLDTEEDFDGYLRSVNLSSLLN